MAKTWTIVANRKGAKIFEGTGIGDTLRFLEDLPNPDGRLHNRDFAHDKPGRTFDSAGQGRHGVGQQIEPTEQNGIDFAREIAGYLEQARVNHAFDRLILVAESQTLGRIRAALTTGVQGLIVSSLDKDILDFPTDKITAEIASHIKL